MVAFTSRRPRSGLLDWQQISTLIETTSVALAAHQEKDDMIRTTVYYARYTLSTLACVGFPSGGFYLN